MTDHLRLAPDNATDRELVIADVADPFARLRDLYSMIREADRAPPPGWMPYLIAEWGLGELTPWIDNLHDLARAGVAWQRVRGTPAAVTMGLGWLGHTAIYERASPRRRRWHLWQLELDRLPTAERPDLDRIDGIASLSDDALGHFWRGHRGYDHRALEWRRGRWGEAIWSDHSGVRISPGGAKWSFGRRHEATLTLGEPDLAPLGTWIEPPQASNRWSDMHAPWTAARYPWSVPAIQSRRNVIAAALTARRWHVVMRRADGSVIGAARAGATAVREDAAGRARVGGSTFSGSDRPTAVLVQSRTPFGSPAAGTVATSIDLVADAPLAAGVGPGRAWLGPADIDVAAAAATLSPLTALDLPLATTVRDEVVVLMRF